MRVLGQYSAGWPWSGQFVLAVATLSLGGWLGLSCGTTPDDGARPGSSSEAATTIQPTTTEAVVAEEVSEEPTIPDTTDMPEPALATVVPGSGIVAGQDFAGYEGMTVGVIVNQTSVVGGAHLIDLVNDSNALELGAIFSPEHGVRGIADAGELVDDAIDAGTGVEIFSLYGGTRQPSLAMLEGLDVLFYDLQDVGARHYTYISTMGLAMQIAAQAGIPFVVLDRPNPLGGERIEGPVLDPDLESFIGQYPIPSVYGMTAGELALAIQGERWLSGLEELDLRVVEMENWDRSILWPDTGLEWIAPSPGLPSFESALVYPGTVLIEATTVSYGNGTLQPFTTVGAPWLDGLSLASELNNLNLPGVEFVLIDYVPAVIPNMAPSPRMEGEHLSGVSIKITDPAQYSPYRTGLAVLAAVEAEASRQGLGSVIDRAQVFDLLTGSRQLRLDLLNEIETSDLMAKMDPDLAQFEQLRRRYLLY